MHELESEYTKHFNLHPSLCLTTVEHLLVGSWYPFSIWYHLNLPSSSPCAMSLSIPSPRSRQHNCKHIYYTLESHTFPPHISFYCVAPVFCFHFLRTSNKALISFKKQEGELALPSSELAGSSREGKAGRCGGASPHTSGERPKVKAYCCWPWSVLHHQKGCHHFCMAFFLYSWGAELWFAHLGVGMGGPEILSEK